MDGMAEQKYGLKTIIFKAKIAILRLKIAGLFGLKKSCLVRLDRQAC